MVNSVQEHLYLISCSQPRLVFLSLVCLQGSDERYCPPKAAFRKNNSNMLFPEPTLQITRNSPTASLPATIWSTVGTQLRHIACFHTFTTLLARNSYPSVPPPAPGP